MNEQQHDKTGAWALNALDPEERARVEAYLAQDPDALAEARSLEETAAQLAASLPERTPPRALKADVLAAIRQTRQLPPLPSEDTGQRSPLPASDPSSAPPAPAQPVPFPIAKTENEQASEEAQVVSLDRYRASVRRSWWFSGAAAALLITTVGSVGLWAEARSDQERAATTIEALESAQSASAQEQQMVSAILASDDATQATVEVGTGGTLSLLYSPQAEAMMVSSSGLAELPEGSVYQMWMIPAGSDPVSAGLMAEPGQPVMREGEVDEGMTFALTVEPSGGSEQPTTEPIAAQEL